MSISEHSKFGVGRKIWDLPKQTSISLTWTTQVQVPIKQAKPRQQQQKYIQVKFPIKYISGVFLLVFFFFFFFLVIVESVPRNRGIYIIRKKERQRVPFGAVATEGVGRPTLKLGGWDLSKTPTTCRNDTGSRTPGSKIYTGKITYKLNFLARLPRALGKVY